METDAGARRALIFVLGLICALNFELCIRPFVLIQVYYHYQTNFKASKLKEPSTNYLLAELFPPPCCSITPQHVSTKNLVHVILGVTSLQQLACEVRQIGNGRKIRRRRLNTVKVRTNPT